MTAPSKEYLKKRRTSGAPLDKESSKLSSILDGKISTQKIVVQDCNTIPSSASTPTYTSSTLAIIPE